MGHNFVYVYSSLMARLGSWTVWEMTNAEGHDSTTGLIDK